MAMPIDNSKDFFVKEFYERTLKILNKYDGEYDVTFLINSMIGLLIVPKERYFQSKRLPDTYIDAELLKQVQATITSNTDNSLKEIIRHLRNSVAHGNMTIKAEKSNVKTENSKIGSILFKDRDGFNAEISIELLKNFLINFATKVCNDTKEKVVTDK